MAPILVDKKEKKNKIAFDSLQVFMETGFVSVSMQEVARRIGIGKGTIYEYFRSKEELITAALVTWMELTSGGPEQFETELDIDDPIERLTTYINMTMRLYQDDERNLKLMVAMIQLWATSPEFFTKNEIIRRLFEGMRYYMVEALVDGARRGQFRPEVEQQAEKIAINLVAYLDGLMLHAYLNPGYIDPETQINLYLKPFLDSIKA